MKAALAVAFTGILVALTSAISLPICPPHNGDYVTLIPNSDDCKSYYACNEGATIFMKCPKGLVFNPVLKVCDWPQNVICTILSTEVPSTQSEVTTPGSNVSKVTDSSVEIILI